MEGYGAIMTEVNKKNVNIALSDYKEELSSRGAIAFVPSGNSMWPTLKNKGQPVIIEKKTGRLNKYDVGFYIRPNGAYVLHRVMEVLPDGYLMIGDSQFNTEKVLEDQVFGIMQGFYKGKKYISCDDKGYRKKVDKWFKRKTIRKWRLKFFYHFKVNKGKKEKANV